MDEDPNVKGATHRGGELQRAHREIRVRGMHDRAQVYPVLGKSCKTWARAVVDGQTASMQKEREKAETAAFEQGSRRL